MSCFTCGHPKEHHIHGGHAYDDGDERRKIPTQAQDLERKLSDSEALTKTLREELEAARTMIRHQIFRNHNYSETCDECRKGALFMNGEKS